MAEKYYITTAIAYTSGKPHIGNTYEIVLTDFLARFRRAQGYDVVFQTGTDEHGEKIELKAEAAKVTPKKFVDGVAADIRRIWDLMNTSYDKFIRTTDGYHEEQVQKIFENCLLRATFTKVLTKVGIARLANPSGRKASLSTANAPTAAEKSRWQARKRISSV